MLRFGEREIGKEKFYASKNVNVDNIVISK